MLKNFITAGNFGRRSKMKKALLLAISVNPLVQSSNSLLEDLRRLNQLNDIVN